MLTEGVALNVALILIEGVSLGVALGVALILTLGVILGDLEIDLLKVTLGVLLIEADLLILGVFDGVLDIVIDGETLILGDIEDPIDGLTLIEGVGLEVGVIVILGVGNAETVKSSSSYIGTSTKTTGFFIISNSKRSLIEVY
jgi:hypothetical protein